MPPLWRDEPVRIVPYDPAWPARFERERKLLEDAIGTWVSGGIHHVGSTAVPGLAAKPVIDILAGVRALAHDREAYTAAKAAFIDASLARATHTAADRGGAV